MRKNGTNLTVDSSVVTRAKGLIEKSGLPFSVTKFVEMLVSETLDALENTGSQPIRLPFYERIRRDIHGETTVQQSIGSTVAKATSGGGDEALEATIRRIMQQELAARDAKPTKRKAS